MKTKLLIANLLIFCSGFSQIKQDQRVWFSYLGQYKVSEKWGYHIEAQFRLDNRLEQNLQNAYKAGVIYYLSSRANITTGYSLIKTFSPVLDRFSTENRLWEQYQFNKKWDNNKNTITHRFRLEERFVEKLATTGNEKDEVNYQSRIRYLNRNIFHVFNLPSEKEEIYAVFQDEVFLSLGNNKVNSKMIDQNRFMVGFGMNYNNNIRLELGYLNQFITSSYGSNAMNHIVSVSLLHSLDFEKQ